MTRLRNETGQTLAISVLFLTFLLLPMTAFVIDVGSWYHADRAAQATADAAALAGAQELPKNPLSGITTALDYAAKNGGGVPNNGISLSGKFVESDTITVRVERDAPGFFAQLFGMNPVRVGASATARSSNISKARWVAPIVVDEKHPWLNCTPRELCFGPLFQTDLKYQHLKANGSPDGSGSFGFINLVKGGGNPGTSDLGEWIRYGFDGYLEPDSYSARTGNPFSSSHVADSLDERIGTELLFPVYRSLKQSGSNAEYEVVAWVAFHLVDYEFSGNKEVLTGYFKEVIWDAVETSTGKDPDYGVRTIKLVD